MRNPVLTLIVLAVSLLFFTSCKKEVDDDRDPNHPYNSLIVGSWKFESDSIIEENTGKVDRVIPAPTEVEQILSLRSDGSAEFNNGFGEVLKYDYYITKAGKFATKVEGENSYSPGSDILLLNSTTFRIKGREYYTTSGGGRGYMTSTYKRK
ncbi:MAG TPA: hypothetical protein PKE30_12535 [Niabella sp.]|nr:hypothetical protein [Niabella sp.]